MVYNSCYFSPSGNHTWSASGTSARLLRRTPRPGGKVAATPDETGSTIPESGRLLLLLLVRLLLLLLLKVREGNILFGMMSRAAADSGVSREKKSKQDRTSQLRDFHVAR